MSSLAGLPYAGSKSARSASGVGRWVASMLPKGNYCEPFAGMCGVLLQRPKGGQEVINDISFRVTNWWTVLRDNPAGFWERLRLSSPLSEFQYSWAVDNMDRGGVEGAVAFTSILLAGFSETVLDYRVSKGMSVPDRERVYALADRMRSVIILNEDANRTVERYYDKRGWVIYCDPPYETSQAHRFYHPVFDKVGLSCMLDDAAAKMAISGYGDEWDHLGWDKHEKPVRITVDGSGTGGDRLECLWTNYKTKEPVETIFD